MLKKNLLNLFLLIVVAALAYLVIHTEPENNLLERLTNINPNSINSITIQHRSHHSHLQKNNKGNTPYWQFTQPEKINANSFRISSLLKLLNAPIHAKFNKKDVDLDKIGLGKINSGKIAPGNTDSSEATTQIKFDSHLIQFGSINPLNGLRFILYNNHVYLIEDVYSPLIRSSFTTLVALELLPKDSELQKLVLLKQTLEKDDAGQWKSSTPLTADTIIKTVQTWQHHQAFAVHDYLKRPALGEVSIFLENTKTPIIYKITDTDPWLILARPELNIEYHLDLDVYNALLSPLDPLAPDPHDSGDKNSKN